MMKLKTLSLTQVASAAFFFACAPAMAQWQVQENAVPVGRGGSTQGFKAVPLPSGSLLIGQSGIPLAIIPTGDVTINAAGVTTIGAGKVTNSMLAGTIAASKLIGTDITTVGTITAGVWNGTTIAVANGGTGSTSAGGARTNLGVAIGSNVQAWDADLDAFALKTAPTGAVVGTTDTQTLSGKTIAGASNTLTVRLANDVSGQLPIANNCPGSAGASNTTYLRGDCVWATPAGGGNVSGPGSAVSDNIVSFNGTSGTIIKDSGISATNLAAAWTTFTPSTSCGTATFTTNSARYKTIGKSTMWSVDISFTGLGTCNSGASSRVDITVPFSVQSSGGGAGIDFNLGTSVNCLLQNGTNLLKCWTGGNAGPWNAISRIMASGVIENP